MLPSDQAIGREIAVRRKIIEVVILVRVCIVILVLVLVLLCDVVVLLS